MEKKFYTSCIKFNGVSILPPMMSDAIREEMKHYKYLAIALEKKMRALRNTELERRTELSDDLNGQSKSESNADVCNSDVDESVVSISDTDSTPTVPNVETVIYMPRYDIESRDICQSRSTEKEHSNVRNNEHLINSSSLCSKTGITNAGSDKSLDVSKIPDTKLDKMEITSETWKPEVPKTLDIVPIMLDSPNNVTKDVTTTSNENMNMPKLMRQGSYVVDTPSPVLLAHMQTEMADADNNINASYVPTPSTAPKRKEWSITEAKIAWGNKVKNTEIIVDPLKGSNEHSYCEEMSTVCKEKKRRKSLCQEMEFCQLYRAETSAKSVNCVEPMLSKETINKSINNDEKIRALSTWTASRNVPVSNLAHRFGGSLGSLKKDGHQLENDIERKNDVQGEVENNCEGKVSGLNKIDLLTDDKLQWSITSEKLLGVFKEIGEMHERQMTDLVARQQKEQSLLQKEFEKQQTRVLIEMRKTFTEMSDQEVYRNLNNSLVLDERDLTPVLNEQRMESLNDDNASLDDNLAFVCNSNVRKEGEEVRTTTLETFPCLLDYIYAKRDPHLRLQQGRCQSTQTHTNRRKTIANGKTEGCSSLNNDKNEYYNSIDTNKPTNVSRQLFPLHTEIAYLPVLGQHPTYAERHVRAATVINAYAKGYLVRRMMKTERIVSLKNTYKEAIICTLKLHADAPLKLSELNFLRRLELQCDAASMNIVELFAQSPARRMQVIAHDRETKRSRNTERPTSARSYSFATQRTLARKRLKEMGSYQLPGIVTRPCSARSRCQTWTSDSRDKPTSLNLLHHSIKRSTSAGTVRKPWR